MQLQPALPASPLSFTSPCPWLDGQTDSIRFSQSLCRYSLLCLGQHVPSPHSTLPGYILGINQVSGHMSFPPGSPVSCFPRPHPSAWVSCPLFAAKQHPVLPLLALITLCCNCLFADLFLLPLPYSFDDKTLWCPLLYPMSLEHQRYLLNEWSGPYSFQRTAI